MKAKPNNRKIEEAERLLLEAGYAVKRKRPPGRAPLPPELVRNVNVQIRMSPSEKAEVEDYAQSKEMSVAECFRDLFVRARKRG